MKLLVIFLTLLFASCASIKYGGEDGFSYQRFGNQELIDVQIGMQKPDGTIIEAYLGKQKSEREIAEIILSVSDNIDKALQILLELERKLGIPFIMENQYDASLR